MAKVKFLKEPGYVYDLFFLFWFHFNKEKYVAELQNSGRSSNAIAHHEKLLTEFGPFSDELLPFFYMKERKKCFITQFYFEEYADKFMTAYDLSKVQEALTDYEQVIENVIRFYFDKITEEHIEECKRSIVAVGQQIKNSDYSAEVKSSLYAFFLEPASTIQKLSYELMTKEFMLSRLYEKSFKKIFELQHDLDLGELVSTLERITDRQIDLSLFEQVYISFCICNHQCVKFEFTSDAAILLLGSKYAETIKGLQDQQCVPELDVFGNALSEKNRIDIIDLILEKEEVTIRDIEQELGFSGTNAYYHLSLMIKANLIKSRNRGRTVIYSINRQAFVAVCDLLSKYASKGKEK